MPIGRFSPDRYRALANTSYDLSMRVFACHKSPEGDEFACAGALLRQDHNLRFRLSRIDRTTIRADGPLYDDFRAMAEANGVEPDDPVLEECR